MNENISLDKYKFIVSEDDYELLYHTIKTTKMGVLEAAELLEYDITGKLIMELDDILMFDIPELDSGILRFYTDKPDESFSKVFQDKLHKLGSTYDLVAMAYKLENDKKTKQYRNGLSLKRVRLPKAFITLIQHSELINCRNIEEINNFKLTKDTFI
jgi:hypothetical protein